MEENKDVEPDNPGEKIPEVEHSEMWPSSEATTPFEDNILPEEEANTTNEQSSTLNSQFSTEQEMEVHHHTHAAHGKKSWKSYFWEFLMLFLAVFCGFLAEYKLEHYLEQQREKKFSKQLLVDLRADSALLARVINGIKTGLEHHKHFKEIMTSGNPPSNRDIVKACIPLYIVYAAPINNATYIQMRSSGGLRYIQKIEVTSAIQNYYESSRRFISGLEEMENDFYKTYIQHFTINHFMMSDIDFLNDTLVNQNPVFLNRSKETEMQLINIMATYESYIRIHLEKGMLPAVKKNNEVIAMLKKEYHLQ